MYHTNAPINPIDTVKAKDFIVKIYNILDSPFALRGTKYDFPIKIPPLFIYANRSCKAFANTSRTVTDENVNIIPITKYADLPFNSAFPVAPLNIYLTPTYITPTIAATFTIIITTPNNLPKRFRYE